VDIFLFLTFLYLLVLVLPFLFLLLANSLFQGYFMTNASVCVLCLDGQECDGTTGTETLEISKGYWRHSELSTGVYDCPLVVGCVGGNDTDK